MTDREIIQGLECCSKSDAMLCSGCSFFKNCSRGFISRNALDLITRQQAEIERLRKVDEAYPCKVDVGNNCLVYAKSLDDYDRLIGDISAEAIKAYAGRLYDAFSAMQREYRKVLDSSGAEAMLIAQKVLKHYEKEMVGE